MAENSLITASAEYSDDNIVTLEGLEHVRRRAGMYIGKLGDGSSADDGIYVLTKEVIDNSIDEFRMKFGNLIEIRLTDRTMSVRDYGRGIPQGKMIDAVSKMNTGGKYDDKAFKKSVGLNGRPRRRTAHSSNSLPTVSRSTLRKNCSTRTTRSAKSSSSPCCATTATSIRG